jgi:hypothetical protein
LAIENIEEVVGYNTNFYDGNIRFFVSITTANLPDISYYRKPGSRTMYTINTETGGVAEYREEYDWFKCDIWATGTLERLLSRAVEEAVEKEIAEFEANLAKELADKAI